MLLILPYRDPGCFLLLGLVLPSSCDQLLLDPCLHTSISGLFWDVDWGNIYVYASAPRLTVAPYFFQRCETIQYFSTRAL